MGRVGKKQRRKRGFFLLVFAGIYNCIFPEKRHFFHTIQKKNR